MAGENIGAPVAATDDDNDTLTYSLDVTSLATFDIVATTGQLQTKAALDYETGTISYTVTVTAVDPSGADDTITVTITVNNVDEAGTVTLSSTQPVEEIRLTATLDDPDRRRQWQRDLVVGGFSERHLLLDPHQWGNLSQLHAGSRRCGRLPAGHRLLHRWRRVGQERPSGLGQ